MRSPSVRLPDLSHKGAVPIALLLALTGGGGYGALEILEQFEGNVKRVYADSIAGGLPTYCAGATDRNAVVGTILTDDYCDQVNRATIIEYGFHVLSCTTWSHLTPKRLIAITMLAINVGKAGACGSQAVKQINAGNIEAGCRLFAFKPNGDPNWSYAGGRFIQGLHNRRVAEMGLCLDGDNRVAYGSYFKEVLS